MAKEVEVEFSFGRGLTDNELGNLSSKGIYYDNDGLTVILMNDAGMTKDQIINAFKDVVGKDEWKKHFIRFYAKGGVVSHLSQKTKVKEILVDLAAGDQLPLDINSLSYTVFYPALKNEKNKEQIAKKIKDILIKLSIEDKLPLDMNEFDTSLLDEAFVYAKGGLTPEKARMILHEGKVHGHPITDQQRKFFGAIASGYPLRPKHEKGGEIEEEYDPENDLFSKYELLPKKVIKILDKYSLKEPTYQTNEKLLKELKPLGYTFDYYLDAEPYNLRKMEKGGLIKTIWSFLNEKVSL